MSVEIWNLEKDLCRCCHAEGLFDNLAEPKYYLEREEIYSDMLRDCFDIEINPVPGDLCAVTYKICEACVAQLRCAVNFKKQVRECEERFMELYYKNAIRVLNKQDATCVKEELPEPFLIDLKQEDIPHLDHDDNNGDDDYCIENDEEEEEDEEDDDITDEETLESKRKYKTKSKVKEEKPKLKRGRPRKVKEEKPKAKKEKKGIKSTGSFCLQPEDYTIEDKKFICGRCDKVYTKMWSLRCHIKTQHYKIPRFTCEYCLKGFMTPAPFMLHKLQDHNIDERHHCKACNETFNTKMQLRKHKNHFHKLGKLRKCDKCDYETYSITGIYKHKFKHKTSKDYHCRFCNKSFVRKTTLNLHERIHTEDRRKVCQVCNKAFVQKASLNYHMTKCHPVVNF